MPAYKRPLYFSGRLEAFQTPTLSADGVLGEKAFAVWSSSQYNGTYAAYKSFAAKSGSACAISAKTVPTESAPWFYTIYFPKGAKVSRFTHTNRNEYVNSAKRIALEASNNNKDWVLLGNYTNTNNVANGVWTVDIPESVQGWFRYYRYKITDRNVTNDSYVTIGFITITADWLSPDIIEIPLYTQQTDEEVAGRAAPIVMDGQTLYAAYGYTDNEFASTIRCKVPGAAYNEGSPTVLLLQQVKEGSMNFGKPGNGSVYTFTVPSGVKVVKITWTQSYDEGSYNRIINTANSKEWWRNDSSGSKTLYVGVTAHKTYVMKNTWGDGSISGMVWSYSKDINAIAPSVTDY